jgi:flavodoxin I
MEEDAMRALVVYDSEFGNTEQVARAIAQALEASANVQIARATQYGEASWQGIDLLVVGCPTQGWQDTKAMKAFLERIPKGALAHTAVAAFDTRYDKPSWLTGSAAKRMAGKLGKTGARVVAPPESFFVSGKEGPLAEGELAHAEAWSRDLLAEVA